MELVFQQMNVELLWPQGKPISGKSSLTFSTCELEELRVSNLLDKKKKDRRMSIFKSFKTFSLSDNQPTVDESIGKLKYESVTLIWISGVRPAGGCEDARKIQITDNDNLGHVCHLWMFFWSALVQLILQSLSGLLSYHQALVNIQDFNLYFFNQF